jgi:thioredoxin 1
MLSTFMFAKDSVKATKTTAQPIVKQKVAVKVEPVVVTAKNFEKVVLKAKNPVLLDIYADWCGPCKRMAPIFQEAAQSNKDKKVTFAKIKMESFEESDAHIRLLKNKLGVSITMVPTFLYVENGKVKETIIGSQTLAKLNTKVSSLLTSQSSSKKMTKKSFVVT